MVRPTLAQRIDARITAIPFMILTARPYGIYRDWAFNILDAESRSRIARAALEVRTFVSFQLPVYSTILFHVGATLSQIVVACGTTVFLMVIVAPPYGLFLDLIRRLLGISSSA